MKLCLLFIASCLFSLTRVFAQEPAATPILIGDGQRATTPQIIAAIHTLIRTRSQPNTPRPIWMLHCDAYLGGPHIGEVFRTTAYFLPQVFTARLIRGESLHCMNATMGQNWWFPDSPVVDGWSLTEREQRHYALVASPEQPFTADTHSFEQPFAIFGAVLTDDDVIAVVDAVAHFAPEQRIQHIEGKTANTVSVMGQSQGRGSDGRRLSNLMIDLQRSTPGWTVTKSGRWEY